MNREAFRKAYSAFVKFAETLNAAIVTVLFAACYLLVVPVFSVVFWLRDPLRLRAHRNVSTYWIEKRKTAADLESFERMG